MASTSSAATDFFLRRLAENNDGSNDGGPNSTSPGVFWGVNAFILFLLLTACCCCFASSFGRRREEENDDDENKRCGGRLFDCCFSLSRYLTAPYGGSTHETRQTSDEAYRAAVIRRRQQEIDARRDSPEKRKRKIIQSFKRCGVRMIVEEADILEPTENVGDALDHAFAAELTSSTTTPTTISAVESELNQNSNKDSSLVVACGIPMASPDENDNDNKKDTKDNVDSLTAGSSSAVQGEQEAAATESSNENTAAADEENPNADTDAADVEADAVSTASSEATNTDGYLLLRSSSNNKNVPRRRVPNCCAICLCPYEVGEAVVWSASIQECPHAYHEECILDWLVKMHQVQQHNASSSNNNNNDNDAENPTTIGSSLNSTPCPCCRADFTDLEKYRKERRIKWSAGNAFNPSNIAWR